MSSRSSGPGRDFDDQYNSSRRAGQEKASRGEGPWSTDKALNDLRRESFQQSMDASGSAPTGGKHAKPNSDSCLIPLGLLGGLGWALTELAGRILS